MVLAKHTVRSNLGCYYRFDSSYGASITEDDTSNSNDLTNNGATSGTGKVRECAVFSRSSTQYFNVASAASIQRIQSICCWVKLASKPASGVMGIVAKGISAANNDNSIQLYWQDSNDRFVFIVSDGVTSESVDSGSFSISTGEWIHLACIADFANGELRMYVNGTLQNTATLTITNILAESGNLYVGRRYGGDYWDGSIDELMCWTEAIPVAFVFQHYNGGDGVPYPYMDADIGTKGASGFYPRMTTASFVETDDGTLFVYTGWKSPIEWDSIKEETVKAGVPAPTEQLAFSGSGTGGIAGFYYAYQRWIDEDGNVSNLSPISDLTEIYGDIIPIAEVFNESPIRIKTKTSHGLSDGDKVKIVGVYGTTSANGYWTVTVISGTQFSLDLSIGNGDFIDNATDISMSISETQKGSAGQNEKQKIEISGSPTGGTFTLTFDGQTTAAIAYDASASGVQSALEALSNISAGDVSVTKGTDNWVVEFTGTYAQTDVPMMTADPSGLTGGSATVSVSTLQDGRASGTQNEKQQLTLYGPPTGGTFTLTFDGQTTAAIAYNATNADVKSALEALSNIGTGDITVTGGPLPSSPIEIEFGGSLGGTDVATLTCDPSSLTTPVGASVSTTQEGRATTVNTGEVSTPDLVYQFSESESVSPFSASNTIDSTVGQLLAFQWDNLIRENSLRSDGSDEYRRLSISSGGKNSYHIDRFMKYHKELDGLSGRSVLNGAYFTTTYQNRVVTNKNTSVFSISFWFKPKALETTASSADDLPDMLTLSGIPRRYIRSTLVNLLSISPPLYGTPIFKHIANIGFLAALTKNGTSYDPSEMRLTYSTSEFYSYGSASSDSVQKDKWSHFVFVLKGTDIDMYLDGVYFTASAERMPIFSNYGIEIGAPNGPVYGTVNAYNSWKTTSPCAIDEVYAWFDKALTQSEVSNLYNNGTGLFYPFTPTVTPGRNEIQTITLSGSPQAGTFTLTFQGESTSIAYDATASQLQSLLSALSSIGAGNVYVTKAGDVFTIEFINSLGETNVSEFEIDDTNLKYAIEVTQTVPAARNEKQRISVGSGAVGGTFTLTFQSATTSSIAYNATAATVQSALEALSTIGSGNVTCTGGPLATNPVDVEFTGTLAQADQPEMTATSSIRAGNITISEYQSANSGLNEKQTISLDGDPTGGYWTLTFGGAETSRLYANSSAATIQSALESLSTIGSGNVNVTGGPLTSADVVVEFVGTLGNADQSMMTLTNNLISGPAVFTGADTITYTNVEVPTDRRVVKRQILRNKDGDATVFYVDIETTDLTSTTLTSTNTDDDLTVAVPLFDDQGNDLAVSRYSVPVSFHKVATYYRGRVFTAGNFVDRRGLIDIVNGSSNVECYDVPIVSNYTNRYVYPGDDRKNQGTISSADPDAQTLQLSSNFAGTTQYGSEFVIHPGEAEDQTIYASEASLPAAFNYLKGLTVSKQPIDGKLTALAVEAGRMFVLFERRLYLYTYTDDPAPPPVGSGRIEPLAWRGCVNNRAWVAAEGQLYFLDEQGIWAYTGSNAVSISDPIRQVFTGEADLKINWVEREYFHAVHELGRNILRWFVCMDGWRYPQHALCYDLRLKRWWVEEYPFPITASCTGEILGRPYVLLGSTNRRIFALRNQSLDVAQDDWPVTIQGTVSSAGLLSLSDSSANFDSRLVGCPVVVASGTGKGQTRRIVAVSGTTLKLDLPWSTVPDTTSTYQIGGIRWTYRTGTFYFDPKKAGEGGRLRVYFKPEPSQSSLSFRRLLGITGSDVDSELSRSYADGDGVKSTENSAYFEIDSTLSQGFIIQIFSEFTGFKVRSPDRIAIELTGVPHVRRQEILGIQIDGASS